MDEDEKREFIEDFILDMVRDVGYMDVHDALWEYTEDDEVDETLARELHDRIINAKVEVKFD